MEYEFHELQRIQALRDLDVLDTLPECEFDGIVAAAAIVCDVPIASLVLVDAERNWCKSQIGLENALDVARDLSFCTHAIDQDGIFEVGDTTQDPRFAANPFVTGEMAIRFYAGAPVRLSDGFHVGTVCVLDRHPRRLDDRQRETLLGLALAAARSLECRKALKLQQQATLSLEATLADLASNRDYMRRVYEKTPAMLHSSDAIGRLILVSDSWLAKLGYERHEVIGRRASEFLTSASRKHAIADIAPQFYRNGFVKDVAFEMETKNGQVIDVVMSAIMDSNERRETVSFTTTVDVTAQKATEKSLAASEDSLRRLYEATPAMLQSIDEGGRILTVSNAWLSTMGYRRQDVTGRRFTDFMTDSSREHTHRKLLPDLFEQGRCDDVDCQMVTRTGTVIDVQMSAVLEHDTSGRVMRSLVVLSDVTARLKAEHALRDSEGRYRMLAHATSDVITQLDLNLVRLYVSPACRSLLGYEPEEMLSQAISATAHPDDEPRVTAAMTEIARGHIEGDRLVITYRKRHKNGHWIWLEAGVNLVRHPDTGAPCYLICVLRDVSQRIAIEEIECARAAAERIAESKSQFLSNISHELRTPLTGILGIHDILKRDPRLNRRQRRYVTLAYTAGQALMAIINDVLDFSKIDAGQLMLEAEPFDLQTLVESSCDCVRAEATKKSLPIRTRTSPDVTLFGDPGRVRQVLVNLVANAVKFTSHGHVGIDAHYDADAARLRLSVSDTGIGIPSDQLSTVFERFHQSDGSITRRYGGTGLGLAICKRLVELMGGTIEVCSTFGVGSTFTVDLPATVAVAEATLDLRPRVVGMTSRRVLLVEDNTLNQTIIAELLRDQGHSVTVVENGARAVDLTMESQRFDVILMDIQMPVMDGFSATRAIRLHQTINLRSRTPIIGLTANSSDENLTDCLQAGMDGRITKPIDWNSLFAQMDELIAGGQIDLGAPAPASDAQILDADSRARLAQIIGTKQLDAMVKEFVGTIEGEGTKLAQLEEAKIVPLIHGWISLAGHLGFVELSARAADVEQDIRSGRGLERVPALQAAILRAVAARGRNEGPAPPRSIKRRKSSQ